MTSAALVDADVTLPYYRYNFFQFLRLLEGKPASGQRLGLDTLPSQEPLRVLPEPALRYPAAEISYFGAATPVGPREAAWQPSWKELRVSFGGLYGVESPLPYHFLDDISRKAPGSDALAGFLDIFNHRLYLLQYQVWKKYRYPQQFESAGRDRISRCLIDLGGFALNGTRTDLPNAHLLAYIGPFSQRVRSAEGLRAIVCEYLGMSDGIQVQQFAPHWVTLGEVSSVTSRERGGQLCLGDNFVLGKRVRDPAGKVRVVIGPLEVKRFFECMPGGKDFADLRALVRLYLGAHIEFDLRFRLRTEGLPPAQLRRGGMRLGWTTFVAGKLAPQVDVTVRNCSRAPQQEDATATA